MVDIDVFHFLLLIADADTYIFALLKLQLKGNTVNFPSGHMNKKNNYTNYDCEKADCDKLRTSSVYFALRKIYTLGAVLPPSEHDLLNWSHDNCGQHECLS